MEAAGGMFVLLANYNLKGLEGDFLIQLALDTTVLFGFYRIVNRTAFGTDTGC